MTKEFKQIKSIIDKGRITENNFLSSNPNLSLLNEIMYSSDTNIQDEDELSEMVNFISTIQNELEKTSNDSIIKPYQYLTLKSAINAHIPSSSLFSLDVLSRGQIVNLYNSLVEKIKSMGLYQLFAKQTPVPVEIQNNTQLTESKLQDDYNDYFNTIMKLKGIKKIENLKDKEKSDFFTLVGKYWKEGEGAKAGWEDKIKKELNINENVNNDYLIGTDEDIKKLVETSFKKINIQDLTEVVTIPIRVGKNGATYNYYIGYIRDEKLFVIGSGFLSHETLYNKHYKTDDRFTETKNINKAKETLFNKIKKQLDFIKNKTKKENNVNENSNEWVPFESIYPVHKFKKGQKVLTKDNNIETVLRINSNGNIETEENDYSCNPNTLKINKKDVKVQIKENIIIKPYINKKGIEDGLSISYNSDIYKIVYDADYNRIYGIVFPNDNIIKNITKDKDAKKMYKIFEPTINDYIQKNKLKLENITIKQKQLLESYIEKQVRKYLNESKNINVFDNIHSLSMTYPKIYNEMTRDMINGLTKWFNENGQLKISGNDIIFIASNKIVDKKLYNKWQKAIDDMIKNTNDIFNNSMNESVTYQISITIDKKNKSTVEKILNDNIGWDEYDEQERFDNIIYSLTKKDFKKVEKLITNYIEDKETI